MKLRVSRQTSSAQISIPSLLVIAILAAVFFAMLTPPMKEQKRQPQRINCVNRLSQVSFVYHTGSNLMTNFHQTGLATNRLAIP
jgi:hypothetical protein